VARIFVPGENEQRNRGGCNLLGDIGPILRHRGGKRRVIIQLNALSHVWWQCVGHGTKEFHHGTRPFGDDIAQGLQILRVRERTAYGGSPQPIWVVANQPEGGPSTHRIAEHFRRFDFKIIKNRDNLIGPSRQ